MQTEQIVTLIIAILVGLYAFYGIFKNIIKARLIEDTPTSKIRSAAQGYIELSGFAKINDAPPLIAPLTGQPCLWYFYEIERYQRTGKSHSWTTVEKKSSDAYFILEDETGECSIDPRRADVTTNWKKTWYGNQRRPSTISSTTGLLGGLMTGNRYRYTEKRIHDKDYLYALGLFQTIHAPSAEQQTKTKMSELLNEWKQDYDKLVARFDQNGDGELDMEEWEAARRHAATEAHYHIVQNYDDTPIHIMAHAPQRRKPYLISNKDPKQLTRRYRLHAAGMTALFFLCSFLSWYLASQIFFTTAS